MNTETKINAGRNSVWNLIREMAAYPELVYFFIWREFKIRYKQTLLGVFWTVLQPLLFASIVGIIVVNGAGLRFDYGASAFIVVFIAFLYWTFFEQAFSGASNSILTSTALLQKIYFPRLIPIVSTIAARMIDFFLSLITFFIFAALFDAHLHWQGLVLLVPLMLYTALLAFGMGTFFAAINIKYRDVKFIQPFIARLFFFATPIWYPFTIIPEGIREFLYFNPLVGIIEFVRTALFDPQNLDPDILIVSSLSSVLVILLGLWVFSIREKEFVDYI